MLNTYFHSQFGQNQLTGYEERLVVAANNIEITSQGIEKLIQNPKNGKSPGPDGLKKEDLLVDCSAKSSCLKLIFQASLTSGKLPSQWKLAYVTPIHKGGEEDLANNYRPISLTSIPCKMMEHIILHYLNQKLNTYLYNRQHGFRRGMSCETQLCATYHDLAKAAEGKNTTHALVLDFKNLLTRSRTGSLWIN